MVLVKAHGGSWSRLNGQEGSAVVLPGLPPSLARVREISSVEVEPPPELSVEGHMTKKDKIAFIRSSKRKTHVYNDLHRFSDQQLNELIREIVQGLVRESEIIANAYINGYR